MPALVAGIHVFLGKTWMAGTLASEATPRCGRNAELTEAGFDRRPRRNFWRGLMFD
jgi:hypothetical protein